MPTLKTPQYTALYTDRRTDDIMMQIADHNV